VTHKCTHLHGARWRCVASRRATHARDTPQPSDGRQRGGRSPHRPLSVRAEPRSMPTRRPSPPASVTARCLRTWHSPRPRALRGAATLLRRAHARTRHPRRVRALAAAHACHRIPGQARRRQTQQVPDPIRTRSHGVCQHRRRHLRACDQPGRHGASREHGQVRRTIRLIYIGCSAHAHRPARIKWRGAAVSWRGERLAPDPVILVFGCLDDDGGVGAVGVHGAQVLVVVVVAACAAEEDL